MKAPLAFLALLLALPGAGAQEEPGQLEACRAPVLSVQEPPETFEAGSATSLLFAVENPNGPPVDAVRATITTTAPAGWSATPAQRELTLGPKNFSVLALAITTPNRGSGTLVGNITLHVTFVCTSGDIQTLSAASTTLPVSIADFRAPWPIVLGAFALLAAGVGILALRRLRRGVAIIPLGGERPVVPGKSVKFTFQVENRRGRPQRFHLLGVGLPEGWAIHLALDTVELEPGEEKTLWAILKAPATARPGDEATVTLRLESSEGAREVPTATLRAKVVEG